uniref:NADH-ubiquinone oxidoreductase chain 6 n=1 Tax=Gelidium sclerophyllum TaxID=317102 RepID=A0A1D8X7I2_9FLOR|nr:NADH dehydrogenase subunit 6 [Gelidium sclerophyllum]AOX48991.1 NADH dehydrogenase subunit 6 [Gelidium sclerophyllum]
MIIEIFLFSMFSLFALISSLMVITLKNAVHSVLFLILVFCNVAGLLLLLGAEFLSFMLLIVYVGAIAVLFLFVVMMLNIKIDLLDLSSISLIPLGLMIFSSLFFQFNPTIKEFYIYKSIYQQPIIVSWIAEERFLSNIKVIGGVLYTDYSLLFLLSSLILLIAMIGVIVLTMHQRTDVKKQQIETQLIRNPKGAVKFVRLRK